MPKHTWHCLNTLVGELGLLLCPKAILSLYFPPVLGAIDGSASVFLCERLDFSTVGKGR